MIQDKLSTKNDVHFIKDLSHQENKSKRILEIFRLRSPLQYNNFDTII